MQQWSMITLIYFDMKKIGILPLAVWLLTIYTGQAAHAQSCLTISSQQQILDGQQIAQISEVNICDQTVRWTQHGNSGSYDTDMEIVGTSGNWDNQTNAGDITYSLQLDSFQVELRLFTEGSTTRLLLNVDGGGTGKSTEIIVSNLTYN
jgi:hypothetical protein